MNLRPRSSLTNRQPRRHATARHPTHPKPSTKTGKRNRAICYQIVIKSLDLGKRLTVGAAARRVALRRLCERHQQTWPPVRPPSETVRTANACAPSESAQAYKPAASISTPKTPNSFSPATMSVRLE